MIDQLDQFFMNEEKFSLMIHKIAKENSLNLFDAVLHYCDNAGISIEDCQKFIGKNLKEKLKRAYIAETKGEEDGLDIF